MSTIINTEFQLATTVISNGAITGNQWSNPNNLLLTDGDVAESNPNQTASDVIIGNFSSANVPSNAVITGIEIELIGAYSGSPTSPPIALTLQAVDNTTGSDIYYPYTAPVSITPTVTDYLLGSSTYLFGTSWTPDMINNFKLALIANGDIYVDAVKINVFYYLPAPTPSPTPAPMACSTCNSPIQVPDLFLALPFTANDRYAILKSFNYADGTPVLYTDLGACGGYVDFVFDPGVVQVGNSNFMENARTAVWTTLPNGWVQLDFVDVTIWRGLQFHEPYGPITALRSDHDANSRVVISDNGPFLGQLLRQCQIGSVVSAPIDVQYNGMDVVNPAVKFNFLGAGVIVTQDMSDPTQANITIAGSSVTPPSVVNVSNFYSNVTNTTYSSPSFVVTGTDRFLTVALTIQSGVSVTGALWNGQSLSTVTTSTITGFTCVVLTLVAPDLGTHTLDLTFSGTTIVSGNMVLYNQVDPSTPIALNVAGGGTSTLAIINATTTTQNSIVFHAVSTAHFPMLYTAGIGESLVASSVAGNLQSCIENQSVGTPATVTTQVNLSISTDWVDIAFGINGIQPPSAPGTVLVDGSDTTSGFLDPKLNIHSSDNSVNITKSITNPSANEVLDYDFTAFVGGEIILQQTFLFSDFVDDGSGNGLATFTDDMPLGAVPSGVRYNITTAFDATSTMEVLDSEGSGQIIGSLVPADTIALLVGKTDGSAVFDWTATPNPVVKIPGIIPSIGQVTVTIIGSGSSGQNAIQFEDESGSPLGPQGSVTEFEITGGGVAGSRTGNKVTYTFPAPVTPVTNVTATAPLISSGGATPDISSSMNTNKLIGRGTAGVGVMEEITLGTGLSMSGTTLNVTGGAGGAWTLVQTITLSAVSVPDSSITTIANFTGLAGNTDDMYQVIWETLGSGSAGTGAYIGIQTNGAGGANYSGRYAPIGGAATTYATTNAVVTMPGGITLNAFGDFIVQANSTYSGGGNFMWVKGSTLVQTDVEYLFNGVGTSGAGNPTTSLQLIAFQNSGGPITVDGKVSLYKINR